MVIDGFYLILVDHANANVLTQEVLIIRLMAKIIKITLQPKHTC